MKPTCRMCGWSCTGITDVPARTRSTSPSRVEAVVALVVAIAVKEEEIEPVASRGHALDELGRIRPVGSDPGLLFLAAVRLVEAHVAEGGELPGVAALAHREAVDGDAVDGRGPRRIVVPPLQVVRSEEHTSELQSP